MAYSPVGRSCAATHQEKPVITPAACSLHVVELKALYRIAKGYHSIQPMKPQLWGIYLPAFTSPRPALLPALFCNVPTMPPGQHSRARVRRGYLTRCGQVCTSFIRLFPTSCCAKCKVSRRGLGGAGSVFGLPFTLGDLGIRWSRHPSPKNAPMDSFN